MKRITKKKGSRKAQRSTETVGEFERSKKRFLVDLIYDLKSRRKVLGGHALESLVLTELAGLKALYVANARKRAA